MDHSKLATFTKRKTKDGKIRWRVRVRFQGYPDLTKTFRTKEEAQTWAIHQESQIKLGKNVPTVEQRRRTLSDLIDRYIEEVIPIKDHNKDRKKTEAQLRFWKEQLGPIALIHLSPDMIAKCRDQLLDQVQKPTVNRYLAALGGALKHGRKEWRWLIDDPMRDVGRFKETSGLERVLTDTERQILLKECESNPPLYLAVFLALSTGMRRSEIRFLTWDQIDLEKQFIYLEATKNGLHRNVPLSEKAFELLTLHKLQRDKDSEFIFPSRTKSTGPWDWQNAFATVRERVGLEDLRFHDLRHCAASYLAMSGCTAPEIASILGHKTLVMVQRYTHIADQHNKKILQRMNNMFL